MQKELQYATVGGGLRDSSYMNIFKQLINPHDPGSVIAVFILFIAPQLYKVSKTHLSNGAVA